MRFLVDESVSPSVAQRLVDSGYDATHVYDVGLTSTPDPVVLEAAARDGRVLITLDTDFGALVARSSAKVPSVVLFRGEIARRPDTQADLLIANLGQIADDLDAGAVVVIGDERVRVRRLPIEPRE